MTILISTQNYLNQKIGINKFIRLYNDKIKSINLERKTILSEYEFNKKKIENLTQFFMQKKIKKAHLHSILDSSVFKGIIDKLIRNNIHVTYFCHSLILEEIEYYKNKKKFEQKLIAQEELFTKSKKIIFLNNSQKNKAINKYPFLKYKSEVIYPGTIHRKITEKKEKVILYVGRLTKEKGILDLCQKFKKFYEIQPSYKLKIIGDMNSPIITQIINILNGTNYELLDWIYETNKLDLEYQKAELVILPSYYDSFNMVGIESIANGTPILVRKIESFNEIYLSKKIAQKFEDKIYFPKDKTFLPKEYSFDFFINQLIRI